jgi:hypothetical protein
MNYMLDREKRLLHQLGILMQEAKTKGFMLALGFLAIKYTELEDKIKEQEQKQVVAWTGNSDLESRFKE